MDRESVDVPTPEGKADAIVFRPPGSGPFPGLVLHTDLMGIRPDFERIAARWAGRGYVVLLPNVYYRAGRWPLFDHIPSSQDPDDYATLRTYIAQLTGAARTRDGTAYLSFLRDQLGVRRAGYLSYSFGGPSALRTAVARPDLAEAVAMLHPSRLVSTPPDDPDSPHLTLSHAKPVPLYLGFTEGDVSMTAEHIAVFTKALADHAWPAAQDIYPGGHGFAIDGHRNHNASAAAAAETKVDAFFCGVLTA